MEVLKIIQGSTLAQPVRWGVEPIIYKPITGVVSLAPLRLTVPGHGAPNGWRTEVESVKGMTKINSTGMGKESDYHNALTVNQDTIEFNDVNATDYGTYQSGTGVLKFFTPADLTNKEFALYIWDKVNGTPRMAPLTSEANDITIDTVNFVITIHMSDAATALLDWKKGVYALKARDTVTGVVVEVVSGPVQVELE